MVTLRVFTKKLLKLSLSVLVYQQSERKNYRLSMMVLFYHRNSKLISFAMTK